MGREAICTVRTGPEGGECRVHLDGAGIEVRGALRLRIARDDILRHAADGETLRIWVAGRCHEIDLGAKVAAAWDKALSRPVPTLAEKLGIGPGRTVFVIGALTDNAAREAIAGAEAPSPTTATLLLAQLGSAADLSAALALAEGCDLPLWCLYPKGKGALPSDAEVRTALRGAGWIDTKSCAVSAVLTATRYYRRPG